MPSNTTADAHRHSDAPLDAYPGAPLGRKKARHAPGDKPGAPGGPHGRTEGLVTTGTPGTAVPSVVRALLRRARTTRRPRLLQEVALIAVSYWIYSLIRNAVPEQATAAQRNSQWVWDLQNSLGLAFETSVNHALNGITWLIVPMNYYYATLHFIVTLGVLVWVYRTQPGRYAAVRTALFLTTATALIGYYFVPLAPPRLFHGAEFVDTVITHAAAAGVVRADGTVVGTHGPMRVGWCERGCAPCCEEAPMASPRWHTDEFPRLRVSTGARP
ncbi:hypothetical protein C1I97_32515 [Streptomyces sp. NTH33]|uniref:phosphatase PAP2 family protein n=1 Tax=Streptomyces sp. NTH33 TaxID=1735453 RepID=UPI000DA7EC62|nr:phosphatase PAP2 family protein [Streptomyces sp. NTH33]PZG87673.1 hypothetical protein C1I97_32515 [Streptomyces sp. NTH33]